MSAGIVSSGPRRLVPILTQGCRGSLVRSHRRPLVPSTATVGGTILRSQGTAAGKPQEEAVYESPLGSLVTRLRSVSLATGLCGGLGVPLLLTLKGGTYAAATASAAAEPSTGLLAFALAFGTGTMGSTAAVHFVFSPYVYSIVRIPIRVCSYKPPETEGKSSTNDSSGVDEIDTASASQSPAVGGGGAVLYKAVSRSLFLTRTDTVFDPATDLAPYKGYRPLCNAVVKGRTLLYVHPEYLHDPVLRQALRIATTGGNNNDSYKKAKQSVSDPIKDDDFL